VRFVCEWCHDQVPIVDGQRPYNEVLAHFTACERRAPVITDEQVAGLAAHIAGVSVENEEKRMRQAG